MRAPSARQNQPRQDVRVLVADKSAHYRETVRRVLTRLVTADFTAEASTVADATSQIEASGIDLILLDIELAKDGGFGELRHLAATQPNLKIAVLLSDDTPEYRDAVRRHGGHFSVAKDSLEDQLPGVLRGILTH